MELTFLGGAAEVGASCMLLRVAHHCLLVDGGMRPGSREGRLPDLHALTTSPPECILITHAHIDHTGALPLIAALYPCAPIYATESTRALMEILLKDAVRIMEQEGLKPDGETPFYTAEQVDMLLSRIQPIGYYQPFAPLPDAAEISVHFLPAGHILGAAMLYCETPEGTILHTGDISVTDQRTVKGLDLQRLPAADVMICEGTYGDRGHGSRKEEERQLMETVQATLARGGRVLCPAFAVGRAQEVLLILKAYRASGHMSPVPIYIDGMIRPVCALYQNQSHDLQPGLQRYLTNARRPLFADPDLHIFAVRSFERSALLERTNPLVVVSSSGMLSGGASPLYAAALARDERNCILFTGYQDEESPGSALLRAQRGDVIRAGEQSIQLHCQIARYNLSAHVDAEQIVHVVARVNPRHLFLVHGMPEALTALARRFKRMTVTIPSVGDSVVALAGQQANADPETHYAAAAQLVVHRDGGVGGDGDSEPLATTAAVALSSRATSAAATLVPELPAPAIADLWRSAALQGPARPWTVVELGQAYYGAGYRPALRAQIEQVLLEAATYFRIERVGAQPTYQPRPAEEVKRFVSLSQLVPGMIVIVRGHQGSPQLALVLEPSQAGNILLIGEQWKAVPRPLNVICLVPGVMRPEWLALPATTVKSALRTWRASLDELWIDLFAWWAQCQEEQRENFEYSALCNLAQSEDERVAWGLELLLHGVNLFRHEDLYWMPFERERILRDSGFAHHLALLRAGKETPVNVRGRRAVLTGRSNWRLFEVRWTEEGEGEGELSKVRTVHIETL